MEMARNKWPVIIIIIIIIIIIDYYYLDKQLNPHLMKRWWLCYRSQTLGMLVLYLVPMFRGLEEISKLLVPT